MAKRIFTSRCIRDAPPEHLQNYVRYISTREGVEKVDESKKNLPTSMQGNDHTRICLDELEEETISDEGGGSASSFRRHGRQDRCDKCRRSPAGTKSAVLRRRRE